MHLLGISRKLIKLWESIKKFHKRGKLALSQVREGKETTTLRKTKTKETRTKEKTEKRRQRRRHTCTSTSKEGSCI